MKKVKVSMMICLILCLISSVIYAFMYHSPEISLTDIKGNHSALKDIRLRLSYEINNASTMDIHLKQGKLSYDIDKRIPRNINYTSEDTFTNECIYENTSDTLGEWKKDSESDEYLRDVEKAKIKYTVYCTDGKMKNQSITIDTDLVVTSNKDYVLKESCVNPNTNDNTSISTYHLHEDGSRHLGLDTRNKDEYYFVPARDQYTTGENYVYQIIKNDLNLQVKKLIALPNDQVEKELRYHDGYLYLLVIKDNEMYMQKYDEKGTLVKELNVENKAFLHDSFMYQSYENIVLGDTIYTIDLKELKIVSTSKTEDVESIYNIAYQNEKLYVLYSVYDEEHKEYWKISVMDHDTCIYEGKITFDKLKVLTDDSGYYYVGYLGTKTSGFY